MSASFPEKFTQRLKEIVPIEHFDACWQSLLQRPTIFRINRLKATAAQTTTVLAETNAQALDWLVPIYQVAVEHRQQLTESSAIQDGLVYIQNPSSLLAVIALAPDKQDRVLDLCAAPGGKTIYCAELMQNQGHIAAVERGKSRFFKLKDNLSRCQVTNTRLFLKDGVVVWRYCENQFDRVLLDAPCSSEARFLLDDPDTYQYWSERKIKQMAAKQKQLLFSAVKCLKPGGRLIYSTCSFAPEENELVIDSILSKFPEVAVEPIKLDIDNVQPGLTRWRGQAINPAVQLSMRILPNEICHGFYICQLGKR